MQPWHLAKGWRKGGPFSTVPRAHQGGRVRRGVLLPASLRRQRQQLARHKRQPAASTRRTGKVPCKGPAQGSRAATSNLRAAREAARIPCVTDDGGGRSHRGRRRQLARATSGDRWRASGSSPRTKQRAPASHARGSRAAAPERLACRAYVRHSDDDGSCSCVTNDDDGSSMARKNPRGIAI